MYILPKELRKELKKPLGKIVSDFPCNRDIITVGDVCSKDALESGLEPLLMVYDNLQERAPVPENTKKIIDSWNVSKIKVKNPPGGISGDALVAIRSALDVGKSFKIEVEGEEDLLVLPCVRYAKNSTLIFYGQPGNGRVMIEVDDNIKNHVEGIISKMEVRK